MIEIKNIYDAVIFTSALVSLREALIEAVGKKADLTEAYLSEANLSGANLSGADLRGA